MASPSLKEPAPDSVIFSFSAFLLSGMLHAPPLTVCSGLASKVKRIVGSQTCDFRRAEGAAAFGRAEFDHARAEEYEAGRAGGLERAGRQVAFRIADGDVLLIFKAGPLLFALGGGVGRRRIDARIPRHDFGQLSVELLLAPIGFDPAEVVPEEHRQYVDLACVGHVALDREVGRRGGHFRQVVVEPAGDAVETGEQFARPFAVGAGGIGAYVSRSAGGDGVELEFLLCPDAARFGVPDRDDGLVRVDVGVRVLEVHRRFEQVVGDLELMDDILLSARLEGRFGDVIARTDVHRNHAVGVGGIVRRGVYDVARLVGAFDRDGFLGARLAGGVVHDRQHVLEERGIFGFAFVDGRLRILASRKQRCPEEEQDRHEEF